MKPKPKTPANNLPGFTQEHLQKFNQAIAWIKHLDDAPNSSHDYASALNVLGLLFIRRLASRAKAGNPEAVRDMVQYGCELAEAIEEIAEKQAEPLRELAARRPDWPVMLARHETSAKLVATYLDNISLGSQCPINADGARVAKYSLRTPINRFVWRELKNLWFSIECMREVPEIARIDLDALPKLTKATAKLWADKALMPFICAANPDFSQVPEFSAILARPAARTRGQQRREIRKDVLRALLSLAPSP